MVITGSPDISVLQMQVTFDISGLLPVINIQNLSTGPNLPGVTWWFEVLSPSGTEIHQGSFDSPDAVGAWSTLSLTDSWPRPFNQIEFSGAPYLLTAYAQDSAGNVYTDDSYSAVIARPNGNTSLSKNFYGLASTNVLVKCQEARIYFEDTTSTSYRGISGTQLSAILRVIYPLDPTYSVPAPFVAPFTSPVLVPISYSSKNYQFLSQSVYNYQLSTYVFVNIQYQQLCTFAVQCNIDLAPLVCEYTNLIDSVQNGSCSDVNEALRKITLINPKFALVMIGMNQPLTGVDVPALIEDIIKIGGFTCDCCNAATGIIPNTASVIDGYSFSVNSVCGDIQGNVSVNGSNIIFNLQDKSYVFNLSSAIPTTAFSITPSTSGCVKTYTLNVSMVQFGTDLANTILATPSLLNLWQTIINDSSNNQFIGDGKCIFTSSSTYTYDFTLANIPINTTFSIITGIQKGANIIPLNFSLNLTNLTAFQTYLNTLGLGTFVVTNPSGQNVLIASANNPNVLSQLTYSISSTNFIATLTSSASGYVPVPNNQVIQAIINYLCGLTDEQVVTSQAYNITYVDANGDIQTETIPAGTPLSEFISTLLAANAETVANTGAIVAVTCKSIKDQFGQVNSPIGGTDFMLGTKGGGACAQVAYLDAFKFMLSAGILDAATKNLFCQFVISCGAGMQCSPYTYFEVLVTNYNTSCSEIVGIEATLS